MNFLKSFSAKTKNILTNYIGGIAWLFSLFLVTDKYNSLRVIGCISLFIAGIVLLYEACIRYLSKEDEMYITHINEAKAESLNRLVYGLIVFCVLETLLKTFWGTTPIVHDWRIMAFALIGISKLITGMYFSNLERKGRYY